jgi:hypothetical protein
MSGPSLQFGGRSSQRRGIGGASLAQPDGTPQKSDIPEVVPNILQNRLYVTFVFMVYYYLICSPIHAYTDASPTDNEGGKTVSGCSREKIVPHFSFAPSNALLNGIRRVS